MFDLLIAVAAGEMVMLVDRPIDLDIKTVGALGEWEIGRVIIGWIPQRSVRVQGSVGGSRCVHHLQNLKRDRIDRADRDLIIRIGCSWRRFSVASRRVENLAHLSAAGRINRAERPAQIDKTG